MDNKKNGIPKLRFPGFTGAWEQRKLGEVVERFDNLRIPVTSSKRKRGITPYYGANGIQDYVQGYTHDGEFVLVAEDGANDLQNYPIHYVNGKVWVNNHAHVLQGKKDIADNLFLVNAIKRIKFETYLVGGSRAKLNADVMMKLPIKIPKLNEQQKLGKYFSRIDSLIALHQRKLEHLQEQKKGLLQKMFPKNGENVPEVRFPGFTDAWEQRRFKDISKLSQGLQIAISKRFTHPGDGKLFYITNEFLNPNSTVKYYIDSPTKNVIAERTDILMTRTGNTGKVVTDVEGVYHNNFFKISYNSSKIDRWFLYYLLNSYPIQREILVRAGNSTIPDLNHNDFYGIKIYIPTIEEQIKIGTFLTKVDSLIALHQRKLEHLELMKKGLLQQMFV